MDTKTTTENPRITEMFEIGAHFGFVRAQRHPSQQKFIFGSKNKIEIFDLEKTSRAFEAVLERVSELGAQGKKILFVGGKNEAQKSIEYVADKIDMPYVSGRFIGGTITNFPEIRKRIERLLRLKTEKEKGELTKYTKKERLLIDRDIERLEERFGGVVTLESKPAALVVIDTKREHIAVAEAQKKGIEIIALCGTDCNLQDVDYAFPANDASKKTIEYFLTHVADAYLEGKKNAPEKKPVEKTSQATEKVSK